MKILILERIVMLKKFLKKTFLYNLLRERYSSFKY